jgi:predicted HTH transcriptional regulator
MLHKTVTREKLKLELQHIEFKSGLIQTTPGLEALCGMLNTDGGKARVIFGVEPNGIPVGVEFEGLDKAQRSLSQKIRDRFEPSIVCGIEVLGCEGKCLVEVTAQRPKTTPYFEFGGRAFIREGSATRQLTLTEKQNLMKFRNRGSHNGLWKCDRCATYVRTLSIMVVTDDGPKKGYGCSCGGEFWPIS